MSTIYRFNSEIFGEHLEKMAVGLIDEFVSYLYSCSNKGNYSYYFTLKKEGFDSLDYKKHWVFIELYDGTTIDDVIKYLNKAYVMYFAFIQYESEINYTHISVSFSESWDKETQRFIKVMNIHDKHFYPFYKNYLERRFR